MPMHIYKQNVKFAQVVILGNCRVTFVETAARQGINAVHLWQYKPPYVTLTQHKWINEPHSKHVADLDLQYE
jgi:hypothetical protein